MTILSMQRTAGNNAVNTLLQRSAPFVIQKAPSANPGMTVTPIDPPNPGMTVTPIEPDRPLPKVAWVSRQRKTADGKQIADVERMRVGDLLIVRLSLANVEPAALRSMGRAIISDALVQESFVVDNTGVVQITFRAMKIGAEHAEVRLIPQGTFPSDQVSVAVQTHVEMSQEALRGQLQEATQYVNNSYHAALLYMAKVSPPYREGWNKVKETLEEAGEAGKPFDEIVTHLALTFIAGLAGGKVAEVLEHLKKGVPLTEGLKELTIHAVEAGVHVLWPKGSTAIPLDPGAWIDACHEQIEAEQLSVGAMLEDMIKANNDNRVGFFRDVDVVSAVHNALKFNGQPMRSLETAAIPTAEDFEKMVWKGFLVGYHGIPDVYTEKSADAWLTIMHRLDNIGEDGYAFVMTYLEESDKLKAKVHTSK